MASNAGLLPRAHDPVYSISKLALVGLTKSLALSHSSDRIRVNCICPGPVEAGAFAKRWSCGRNPQNIYGHRRSPLVDSLVVPPNGECTLSA